MSEPVEPAPQDVSLGQPPAESQLLASDPQSGGAKQSRPDSNIIPPEVMEKLPENVRHSLEFMMTQISAGPMPNPMYQHMTAAHLDTVLANSEKSDEREHEIQKLEIEDRGKNRTAYIGGAIFILVAIGAIYYFVPADKLTGFQDILKQIFTFALGGAAGYGIKSANQAAK